MNVHAAALKIVANAAFHTEVLAAARDTSAKVRQQGLKALWYRVDFVPGAVPALVDALADADSACRGYASHALRTLPPSSRLRGDSEEAWRRLVVHADADVCRAALELLRDPPEERAGFVVGLARSAMRNARADIRKAAVELLRHTNRDAASVSVSSLTDALDDGDADARREVIAALAWLGADAIPALRKLIDVMLNDEDESVRREAVRAVLTVDPESKLTFAALAAYQGEATRQVIVRLLASIGGQARSLRHKLLEQWSTQKAEQRQVERQDSGGASRATSRTTHSDATGGSRAPSAEQRTSTALTRESASCGGRTNAIVCSRSSTDC